MSTMTRWIPLMIAAVAAAWLAGCASSSDMDALRAEVRHAQKTADQARDAAANAEATAQEAKRVANDIAGRVAAAEAKSAAVWQMADDARKAAQAASAGADKALSEAATANKAVADMNDQVNRVFKKSMRK